MSERVPLEPLVKMFREFLGDSKWNRYYSYLLRFLLGKLTREEFQTFIEKHFLQEPTKAQFVKYHNRFLLASLANAFRDAPNPNTVSADGFGFLPTLLGKSLRRLKPSDVSSHVRLKKDVMSLTIKERRRIKNISPNTDPKIIHFRKKFLLGTVAQERLALLPRIPAAVSKPVVDNKPGPAPKELPEAKKNKTKNINLLQIKVDKDDKNLNMMQRESPAPASATTQNIGAWTQEVMAGLLMPSLIETHELPDLDALRARMLGIMREHGLLGALPEQSVNVMFIGLENYLKNVLEAAIDTVRYRRVRYDEGAPELTHKRKLVLTSEDLHDTFRLAPHLLQVDGTMERVGMLLMDEDMRRVQALDKSGVLDLLPPAQDELVKDKKRKQELECVRLVEQYLGGMAPDSLSAELKWLLNDLLDGK